MNQVSRGSGADEEYRYNVEVDVSVAVGTRCKVAHRGEGTVRFAGKVEKKGVWIGVELDEKRGRGDGTAFGQRFFTCEAGHGIVVRPNQVRVAADAAETPQ